MGFPLIVITNLLFILLNLHFNDEPPARNASHSDAGGREIERGSTQIAFFGVMFSVVLRLLSVAILLRICYNTQYANSQTRQEKAPTRH